MPRESHDDLKAKEAFFRAMWEWYGSRIGVDEQSDPIRQLDALKSQYPSKLAAGLNEAVNDLVEAAQDIAGSELDELDALLASRGAPTLTSMRLQQKRLLARLLRRGQIERVEEYRVLMERLNDTTDSGLQGQQREIANRMVADFESQAHPEE